MDLDNPQAAEPAHYLPWQEGQWSHLIDAVKRSHLPHALLMAGVPGVGKREFALALAHFLLCDHPVPEGACGECRQCRFIRAGSHPDLKMVTPEEKGRQIRVDQVRGVVDFFSHTAQQGGFKITLIYPAESMNTNAANALLKCLEEPAGQSLLVLIADSPGRIPATIRSRCQQLRFPAPDASLCQSWLAQRLNDTNLAQQLLQETPGQPLVALERASSQGQFQQWDEEYLALLRGEHDALTLADQWQQWELPEILDWLARRISALVAGIVGGAPLAESWKPLVASANAASLYVLLDEIQLLNQQVMSGSNPNRQLALENLLLLSCDKFHSEKAPGPWRTAI